jgi:prepilin-type N-terminal cleavage/methylation domain-containing protein
MALLLLKTSQRLHCDWVSNTLAFSAAGTMNGHAVYRRQSGFTWVEMLIVTAIIGFLAAIAIPTFVYARTKSARKTCIANLKDIDRAKSSWALDQRKNTGDVVTDTNLFGAAAYIREKPQCPGRGKYALNPVGVKPRCDLESQQGHCL